MSHTTVFFIYKALPRLSNIPFLLCLCLLTGLVATAVLMVSAFCASYMYSMPELWTDFLAFTPLFFFLFALHALLPALSFLNRTSLDNS
jgi:hypothetical protein